MYDTLVYDAVDVVRTPPDKDGYDGLLVYSWVLEGKEDGEEVVLECESFVRFVWPSSNSGDDDGGGDDGDGDGGDDGGDDHDEGDDGGDDDGDDEGDDLDEVEGLEKAAFHLGMAILPNIYMGFAPPTIVVRAHTLTLEEMTYWTDEYRGCFAEFFFLLSSPPPTSPAPTSGVAVTYAGDPENWFSLHPSNASSSCASDSEMETEVGGRVLVPLGGGKDSITAFYLLQEAYPDKELGWFYLGDGFGEFDESWRLASIVETSGAPVVVMEGVFTDGQWEEASIYDQDVMPWALMATHAAVFAALLHGYDSVALGHERSCNFGNGVFVDGLEVNHQYDKSAASVAATSALVQRSLGVQVWSPLSPLWETQIMALFVAYAPPILLRVFISCNLSPDESGTRWCGVCPKCLFVFALVSAFAPHPADAWALFGDNAFALPDNVCGYQALLGLGEHNKPLECVGTPAEVAFSLSLATLNYRLASLPIPYVLQSLAPHLEVSSTGHLTDLLPNTVPPSFESFLATTALPSLPNTV